MTLLVLTIRAEASFFPADGPTVFRHKENKSFKNYDKSLRLLQFFEDEMASLVRKQGGQLKLVLEVENDKVNAQALREDNNWLIVVYGGIVNHPQVTAAELTLVLCHELGHHLGGVPTASRAGWSSCEGQADYWSALSCFKRLRPQDDAAQVALNLTQLYARQTSGRMPDLTCREETRLTRTFYGYPSPQCRLDTLLAGFLGERRPECWYLDI